MSSRLDELDGYYKEIMLGEVIEDGQKEVPFQQAIVSCTPGLVAGELKFSIDMPMPKFKNFFSLFIIR